VTIEIRQLIIRAVVPAPAQPTIPVKESEIVARCVRTVLRQLERKKER
jgi:hypothetical protein